MTTNQSLILRKRNGEYIDLTAAPYAIGRNFVVPSLAPLSTLAGGSSANVYGGSVLTNIKYNDRVWSFEIRILSTSEAIVRIAARRVDDFVREANRNNPVYVEYRTNTDTPEPLWGQYGAALRYEIVDARVEVYEDYADGTLRDRVSFISVDTTIKPFADGKQQLACTATGGIQEQYVGSSSKLSIGTIIPEAVTNKMTNPVFGHGTFGNGWTAAANLTAAANTDQVYMLRGTLNSARLQRTGADNTYTQSIAAGNTNKHSLGAIVKLGDGSAITNEIIPYLATPGGILTSVQSLGDGWYWIKAENIDGVVAAQAIGVQVATYKPVYLAAIQYEEKAYCTWPAWGDLLGCAWTGTAHASTSTRTAASCKVPIGNTIIQSGQGSVRLIARFDVPNTHPNDMYLFDTRDGTHANTPVIFFFATDDKLYFQHSGASTASAALTFSAGTTYIIHATWDTSGAVLYINGASVDTDAYTPNALGANMFIGSSATPNNNLAGAIIEHVVFSRALTATEVANDYTNLAPLVSAGTRCGSVPWFWTDDGDGILALDTGKQPLGIVSGIPGSVPAITDIRGTTSSNFTTVGGILISNFPANITIPISNLLIDSSGTVLAGDYGGQHRNETATVTVAQITTSAGTISNFVAREMHGLEVSYLVRIKAASATTLNLYAAFLSGPIRYSVARKFTTSTSYRLMRTKTIVLDLFRSYFTGLASSAIIGGAYAATDASTLSVDSDYTAIVPRELIVLAPTGTSTMFALRGREARYATATAIEGPISATGDAIEFYPNKYNHLQCYLGAGEAVDPLTTYTTTITAIYITPRWALL